MHGFELRFNVYAESAEEVEEARAAIVGFIDHHARQGRAVTARKIAEAVRNWERNPIVKSSITKYFS